MGRRILVVDDDPVQRRLLEEALKRFGYESKTAENGLEALSILNGPQSARIDLVILDLVMPELDGIAVLQELRKAKNGVPVIVQTAHGGIDTVVGAMRAGAQDFVVKPISPERLQVSINNLLKVSALEDEITRIRSQSSGTLTFANIVTRSDAMDRVLRLGERAAASNIPILIEGESGVGKELIARAIQGSSDRRSKPFVTVNCGAIPDHLVESILFGHEKGAFTGAVDKHIGKFQEANGGTLFLDEVGELPLDVQVKLLRALQEGEVDPVGARKPVKVDFRLISATNRRLMEQVKEGKFREDLYYRLNVFPIWIPPLKDRLEDIPELLRHFVARFAAEEKKPQVSGCDAETLNMLQRYEWPGNIRQLENAVFRAVVLCDGAQLTVNDFPQIAQSVGMESLVPASASISPTATNGPSVEQQQDEQFRQAEASSGFGADQPPFGFMRSLDDSGHTRRLEKVEEEMIRLAITHYGGRMTEVAKRLGIGRSTLYRKLKEYGLEDNSDQSAA
ncbi:sigma-54-dependent Fis family transcriptional regulator [Rhodobacteraceae bacterium RKSG542]|uniref:sigma-54-dependent transcriptional regulator n=1 Tax=Pseudovibrio flavus TaxID=2529854 RepID=UPI0012BB5290|nr:sigma-54 dependent transcriptional regulator [Pseudovibrio flavus]MTI16545.1 sigma-54-dependent Fis family transcriptional regulator [Pseudovibrio flavus]